MPEFRHTDDEGALNLFVGSDGNALLLCSECGVVWELQVQAITDHLALAGTERRRAGNTGDVDDFAASVLQTARQLYPEVFPAEGPSTRRG